MAPLRWRDLIFLICVVVSLIMYFSLSIFGRRHVASRGMVILTLLTLALMLVGIAGPMFR